MERVPELPEPFEDPHLKERTLKIAARQCQGAIIVSASSADQRQGIPLPYIHDLQGLRPGSYPYAFECEWGGLKYERELSAFSFEPIGDTLPPEWAGYDLHVPLQPVTAIIDRSRRLARIQHEDAEINLADVPVFDTGYSLLGQVNQALAASRQPFVAWRLEWTGDESDRLWPDTVPTVRNEHARAYLTGYALDDDRIVYLDMVGHKTVLESIRATIQAKQRKRLYLDGKPAYPLDTHYFQVWQHLPDYGAYHAALIADSALPGKWQPGEDAIYLLVFEGNLHDGSTPGTQARSILTSRLSESLPIPILDEWHESLWEAGRIESLIVEMETGGDCQEGYLVQLTETVWKEVITRLLKERKIRISGDR